MTERRLLVVDEQHNTEEVLKAVLEPTGAEVTRVDSWGQIRQHEPNRKGTVLVVHSHEDLPAHPDANSFSQTPRVIIGRTTFSESPESSCREHQLDDLFEFKDLLRAIEGLWNESA